MLGNWQSHADFQQQVAAKLSLKARLDPHSIWEYATPISKLYILNLDTMKALLAPLYSSTGRPSVNQPGIFRSLVLMNHLGCTLDDLLEKLSHNFVLRTACGFGRKLPGVASYYDFINRVVKLPEKSRHKPKKRKPKEKYGKGKMPPKHPNIVKKLVDQILNGRRFDFRPERLLQEIFAKVAVQPSINLGLVPKTVSISGDGTCIETGASSWGRKTCGCDDFFCDCPRKFSDPNASWGWDSHNERYFYGYMGYFISIYNRREKLDLPLYLRVLDAKRHDSVSAVIALAEFRDLYPDLAVDAFISDSASDNYATYELLDKWGINAVIALNKTTSGNLLYAECLVNGDGVPICPAGQMMVRWGSNRSDRFRIKWRCPYVLGKCGLHCACLGCSPSTYGRVVYTKPEWDLRLFTIIPRGSDLFKKKMRERTATERVNNRILHDYGLEESKVRGKKRISFFATIAAFNIHLDAQLAKLKDTGCFDFDSVFGLKGIYAA
ncbi:MAG: transposase [Oscillospiraceae bacterium]|nr:transposase [Oscillospiraceae bacterium]